MFRQAVQAYGLGSAGAPRAELTLPGYDDPPAMEYATAADG